MKLSPPRLPRYVPAALACLAAGAAAEPVAIAPPGVLEEVVVTAQYRRQSLYEVPISLTALDGEQLDTLLAGNIDGLGGLVPGLSGWQQGLSTPIYALRGISTNSFGIGGESSIGVFVDDAYIGRINSTGLRLPDVERVEVLKGPQGSLLGRNASAGAILYHTRPPTAERSLDLNLLAGDYDTREIGLTANTPVAGERLLLRVNAFYREQRGDAENILWGHHVGGEDGSGLRLVLRYDAAPLTADLSVAWQELKSGGLGYETLDPTLAAAGGVRPDPFDDVLATDIRTYDRIENRDLNLRIGWQPGARWRLRSITAWHRNDSPNLFDVDGSAVFLSSAGFTARDSETFSQEFRLTGETDRLEWLAGISYFVEEVSTRIELGYSDSNRLSGIPVSPAELGFPSFPDFTLCDPVSDVIFGPCQEEVLETTYHSGDYHSAGLYGDLSWRATERLTLSAGLRYAYDQKDFKYRSDPVVSITPAAVGFLRNTPPELVSNLIGYSTEGWESLSEEWDAWQPRLAANYQFDAGHSLYLNLARGYKAGGFEPAATPELSVYDPETVTSFDLGVRGKLVGGRFSYDVAVYYYDNEDYQVQIIANGIARTVNSDGVEGRGLDWELNGQLGRYWLLRLQGAFTDATYKDLATDSGSYDGNRTVVTPRRSAGLALEYRGPLRSWGGLGLAWQSQYQSDIYYSVQNSDEASRPDLHLHHLRLSYFSPRETWALHLHARNLFDEEYTIFQDDVGGGLVSRRGMPRQLLAELQARF